MSQYPLLFVDSISSISIDYLPSFPATLEVMTKCPPPLDTMCGSTVLVSDIGAK